MNMLTFFLTFIFVTVTVLINYLVYTYCLFVCCVFVWRRVGGNFYLFFLTKRGLNIFPLLYGIITKVRINKKMQNSPDDSKGKNETSLVSCSLYRFYFGVNFMAFLDSNSKFNSSNESDLDLLARQDLL